MTETPRKLAAYFAVAGAWAVMSGLLGLVTQPGFTAVLAIGKLVLGIAFLVAARQVNESLLRSPQKLLRPLWGTGAWIITWFFMRAVGDGPGAGSTLAGNLFTLMWLVFVLLIVWYLRKNVLRLSAAARLNPTGVTTPNSTVTVQSVRPENTAWDALAGFALLSGVLPIMLLRYLAQFKPFGQALALSFYIGLSFLLLLAVVLILGSCALWVAAAAAVWYHKRLGLLFLTILCSLRSTIGVSCLLVSLKLRMASPKPGAALSAHQGQSILLTLVLVTAIYATAGMFSWRCYRSA